MKYPIVGKEQCYVPREKGNLGWILDIVKGRIPNSFNRHFKSNVKSYFIQTGEKCGSSSSDLSRIVDHAAFHAYENICDINFLNERQEKTDLDGELEIQMPLSYKEKRIFANLFRERYNLIEERERKKSLQIK